MPERKKRKDEASWTDYIFKDVDTYLDDLTAKYPDLRYIERYKTARRSTAAVPSPDEVKPSVLPNRSTGDVAQTTSRFLTEVDSYMDKLTAKYPALRYIEMYRAARLSTAAIPSPDETTRLLAEDFSGCNGAMRTPSSGY